MKKVSEKCIHQMRTSRVALTQYKFEVQKLDNNSHKLHNKEWLWFAR